MGEMGPTICLLGLEEPLERVVASQLRHEGYRIVHGDDLAALAHVDPTPAAVVIDLDSIEFVKAPEELAWLRSGRWDGPALLLTTDRIAPRRQRLLGGAAVLCKPFTMEQLLTQLGDCLTLSCGAER
jgi:DNA-binding response OmpR family regulator